MWALPTEMTEGRGVLIGGTPFQDQKVTGLNKGKTVCTCREATCVGTWALGQRRAELPGFQGPRGAKPGTAALLPTALRRRAPGSVSDLWDMHATALLNTKMCKLYACIKDARIKTANRSILEFSLP